MKVTLASLSVGESGVIKDITGDSSITKRLMEMGILPGVMIKVVRTAPFGCPIQVRVKGYNLAMRKSEAESIEIQTNKSNCQKS
jgi:ferrous iron transport protein A